MLNGKCQIRLKIFLIIILLFLSIGFAGARVGNKTISLSINWFTDYYLNPQPDKVPAAIDFYCDSSMYEKSSSRMPMAYFFSALFKNDNKLMEKAYQHVSTSGSEKAKIFTLNILWVTNSTNSHKLITPVQ